MRDLPGRGDRAARQEVGCPRQRVGETAHLHRLGDVVVHAGGNAGLAVTGHRVGGHCDDVGPLGGRHPGDDAAGRLEAVKFGHLHIHEDTVEFAAQHRRERLGAVVCDHGGPAQPLEHAHGDLLVDRVILGEQDAQTARVCLHRARRGHGLRPGEMKRTLWRKGVEQGVEQLRLARRLEDVGVDPALGNFPAGERLGAWRG